MKLRHALIALSLAALHPVHAQVLPPPQNVLALSAQASAEVTQDLLTIVVSVTREGADAATVQSQLRQVLDTALADARRAVRPGQLDLRTGQFGVYPRYSTRGTLGRDMAAISQLAGRVPGMAVARVGYGLSKEAREKAEAEISAQAIQRFKARAEDYARQFGFGGWGIREVNVGQADAMPVQQPMFRRAMAAQAPAADESVPVEAGRTTVTVVVNGSVQMSAR